MQSFFRAIGLLILLFTGLGSFAQNVGGLWIGKLTQIDGGLVTEYRFRMDIRQSGKRLVGTTFVSIPDRPELFAEMSFEGNLTDKGITFSEKKVMRQEIIMLWEWCIKEGNLQLDTIGGNIWVLEGPWKGGPATMDCPPGKIRLEKEVIVPEKQVVIPDSNAVAVDTVPAIVEKGPELAGRKVEVGQSAVVAEEELRLLIWDADKEDGDIISLNFNGDWVLENYKLKNKKREVVVKLVPNADNTLALYALNEGKIPPNTAAVMFWDGKAYQKMRMQSDLEKCGAIQFTLRR